MKKLIFTIASALMLCTVSMKAQITLDTIITPLGIGYDFYTVQISANETKYYFADTATNTFSLYNMDFTPFMTNIAVPEPFANFGFFALYITRTLFDCDSSNIEYLYQATGYNDKPVRIVRTDGTILFQLDSAVGPYCSGLCLGYSDFIVPIRNTSAGTKLFLGKYDSTGRQLIHIYSLCGELPTDVFELMPFSQSFVKIFPNPASGLLTFQINPPDNMNEYELVILDGNAREIRREKINLRNTNYTINMTNYSSGTYYYSLCTMSKAYQSGKFILTR